MTGGRNANNDTEHIDAVSLRLPQFWPHSVRAWFLHAEANFATRGVRSDLSKFNHVLSSLDEKSLGLISDILNRTPEKGSSYEWIKTQLLKRFELSVQERIDMILDLPPSDRKPSEQLRYMRSIYAPENPEDPIFARVFWRTLPADVVTALSCVGSLTLEEAAERADLAYINNRLAKTTSGRVTSVDAVAVADAVAGVSRRAGRTGINRKEAEEDLCYYHRTYGNKAQKCRKPCTFKKQENQTAAC